MTEIDKLRAIKDKSQLIGEFLESLSTQGLVLCTRHEHDENCYINEELECGYIEGEYYSVNISIEQLLADYFKIDLKKVEEEKQLILKQLEKQK